MNKLIIYLNTSLIALLVLFAAPLSQANVTLNSTNFPDANFRAAVAQAAGVNDGDTFNEANLTTLDVSGKSITSIKGLEKLTGLTYLNVSNNTLITGADLTQLTALTTVKASRCNITTLAATSRTTPHAGAGLLIGTGNHNILYLDLSRNADFYYSGNLQYLTQLETLLLNDCTGYDYWNVTPGASMRSIKWLDISNTACDRIYLPNATGLKHLKAANTQLRGFSSSASYSSNTPTQGYIQIPVGLNTLEYLNLADCSNLNSFQAIYGHYHVASLDTLILTNDTNLGWSNTGMEAQTGLTYMDVTNCAISTAGPDYIPDFGNLKNLETLLYGENPEVGYLRITGNSHLKTLDLHDNTRLTMLALDNCGLPRSDISIDDTNCPALTGLKLNNNSYGSVSEATGNATAWGLDNIRFLYLENNSGFTGGPLTLDENDCGGLTGIDLGNNGFTSFYAPSLPSSLTALMLGNTPEMTRLEMHNNPGITKMAADTVMRDGSGLYLLGNTALTYMDISGTAEQPNHFQHIGNNFSMQGLPIDTIKGSYNKFYTFRNLTTVPGGIYETFHKNSGAYGMTDAQPNAQYYYYAFWPTMAAREDSASVEQLTGLKYLDLSHCQLKDSVYLHKNTELRYLDVSHNRTIARYTSSQDKGAGYRASIPANSTFNRDYPDYKKYLWLVDTKPQYPYRQEAYDQEYYTMDYNDTTGLYILDLMDNDKLEYLDISYTGIQQTAATHCHVSNARFIWIQDLHNLKYFYANYNGMRSMGVGTLNGKHHQEALKSLERLSVIGMRGADVTTMQGSINFLNNNRCPNLHYVNVSYSDFDSIGVHNPTIDTLIVNGNPIHQLDVQDVPAITYIDATECAFKQRGYDPETNITVAIPDTITQRFKWTYYDRIPPETVDSTRLITMNGARDNGQYTGNITTPYSGLRIIRAYRRPNLTTLLVNNSNALTEVYCHYDPKLTGITGFDDLAYPKDSVDLALGYGADIDSLSVVWVNDDYSLIDLNLTKNVNLHYLRAFNDKALGEALGSNGLDLSKNENLITAWVSNSSLERFINGTGEALDTLKIWDNPKLAQIDVRNNTGLKHFDLRNCRVRNLDMSHCGELIYFDCSNDSIKGNYDPDEWFGYALPRACPVPDDVDPDKDGKNCIADLLFSSKQLKIVKADKNDLFSLKGLNDNPGLDTLSYCYNHINGIDLTGCTGIKTYRNTHNGRGVIFAELAEWKTKDEETDETNDCSIYYLQLKENAGDAIGNNNTFLGLKMGNDSIETPGENPFYRYLETDGFIAARVDTFKVNSSGPYLGNRGGSNNAPRYGAIVYGPDDNDQINLDKIYGEIAVLKKYNEERNYIEYTYFDGRPGTAKDGSGATSTFYLVWKSPGTPTEVEEIDDDLGELTVVSQRYYDISGIEHDGPFNGMNIIVKQMSDGSTQTEKVMR